MLVAVPATPVKPTTPAMRAMTRNVMAQLNIRYFSSVPFREGRYGLFIRNDYVYVLFMVRAFPVSSSGHANEVFASFF
jgi:hypothetical protein